MKRFLIYSITIASILLVQVFTTMGVTLAGATPLMISNNLSNNGRGANPITVGTTKWAAQAFSTDATQTVVTDVTLALCWSNVQPVGTYEIEIWDTSGSGGAPGAKVADVTTSGNAGTLPALDTSGGPGNYYCETTAFSGLSIALSASTEYYLVAKATGLTSGYFTWLNTNMTVTSLVVGFPSNYSNYGGGVWNAPTTSYPALLMRVQADSPATPAAPTVSTDSIETLQDRQVNATLSSLGSPASVSAYGVVYNTTGTPTISDSKVDKGNTTSTGAYTVGLDGMALTPGTKYYVRAFATNATGTSYGTELEVYGAPATFTVTAPLNNATNVSTSPTLSWTASTGATDYEYCVAVAADIADCTTDMHGPNWHGTHGATSANLSGLLPGTNYLWGVRAVVGSPASYTWGFNGALSFSTASGPVNHTVIFDANGGTGSMSDQIASSSTALTNNTFTRTGFSFAGWNTVDDGSGTSFANGAAYDFSADATLYAQWTAMPNRLVIPANASQDGWILESRETSETGRTVDFTSTVLIVGDDASDRQYRSVISFDTSSLPDTAVITQAMLSFRINEVVGGGNPIKAFNYFMADVTSGWFGSTSSLAAHDFAFSPTLSSGPLNVKNVGAWYYLDLKTGKTAVNTTGLTQIRLRFNLGDNDNGIANLIKIYSGNSAVKPQLSLWYTIP